MNLALVTPCCWIRAPSSRSELSIQMRIPELVMQGVKQMLGLKRIPVVEADVNPGGGGFGAGAGGRRE